MAMDGTRVSAEVLLAVFMVTYLWRHSEDVKRKMTELCWRNP